MPSIRTLTAPLVHEVPKIKGSRFIASVSPTVDAEAALGFVEACRARHADATHNCFAWRLEVGDRGFRASDDGEPSGTAGRPILQAIDGRDLAGVTVVVTRYYGGTKLGTGGLVRAYGGAAAEALDLATVVEVPVVDVLRLVFPYELTGPVQGVLTTFGLEPGASDYGAEVTISIAVEVERTAGLRACLGEATAGRIRVEAD